MNVKIKDRIADVQILENEENCFKVKIDDVEYLLDIEKVEEGVYSILNNGQSTNMEMIVADKPTVYNVNTRTSTYNVEILDSKARLNSTGQSILGTADRFIHSPMPGKIVKVLVQPGDVVIKGQTLVVLSAMKMESEYKSPTDGIVKAVFVAESETIEGNRKMVELEPATDQN